MFFKTVQIVLEFAYNDVIWCLCCDTCICGKLNIDLLCLLPSLNSLDSNYSCWWHLFCLFIIVISCSLLKIKIWKLYHVCIDSALTKSSAISAIHHHFNHSSLPCLFILFMKIACYNINLNEKYIWRWASLIPSSHQDHYHLSEKPLRPFLYLLACAWCSQFSRLGFLRGKGCFVSFSYFKKPLSFPDFSPHSHLNLHCIKTNTVLRKENNFLSRSILKWALTDHRWAFRYTFLKSFVKSCSKTPN